MKKFGSSKYYYSALHFLCPGLGHAYLREYAFGSFIFLIMLIASILFFVSFLISLPATVILVLLGLPLLFFTFSFVDLYRMADRRPAAAGRSSRVAFVILLMAIIFQVAVPITPVNFLIRNLPDIYVMEHNHLKPKFSEGNILRVNRLAYTVNLFFFDRPLYHSLPEYFDFVKFARANGQEETGLVIGQPGDEVEISGGLLVVNGHPMSPRIPVMSGLSSNWPLTVVDEVGILVATFGLGKIDEVHQVPMISVSGRVGRLF